MESVVVVGAARIAEVSIVGIASKDNLSEDGTGAWCQDDQSIAGTLTSIGSGKANTDLNAAHCAGASATKTILALTFGGKNDWFLPSSAEAVEFFNQQTLFAGNYALSGDVGHSDPTRYLTSSQDGNPALMQYLVWLTGEVAAGWKAYGSFSVRPIRAF